MNLLLATLSVCLLGLTVALPTDPVNPPEDHDPAPQEPEPSKAEIIFMAMKEPNRYHKALECMEETNRQCQNDDWGKTFEFEDQILKEVSVCVALQYWCENKKINRIDPVSQLMSDKTLKERYTALAEQQTDPKFKQVYLDVGSCAEKCTKETESTMPDFTVNMDDKPEDVSADDAETAAQSLKNQICTIQCAAPDTPFEVIYDTMKHEFEWLKPDEEKQDEIEPSETKEAEEEGENEIEEELTPADILFRAMKTEPRYSQALECQKEVNDQCHQTDWGTALDFDGEGNLNEVSVCLALQYWCENKKINRIDPKTHLISEEIVKQQYTDLSFKLGDPRYREVYLDVASCVEKCTKETKSTMPDFTVNMEFKPQDVSDEDAKYAAQSLKNQFCTIQCSVGQDKTFESTFEVMKNYFAWLQPAAPEEPELDDPKAAEKPPRLSKDMSNIDIIIEVMKEKSRFAKAMECNDHTDGICQQKDWQLEATFENRNLKKLGFCIAYVYYCENQKIDRIDPQNLLIDAQVAGARYTDLANGATDEKRKGVYLEVASCAEKCKKDTHSIMPDFVVDESEKPKEISASMATLAAKSVKLQFCTIQCASHAKDFETNFEVMKKEFPWLEKQAE